MARKRWQFVSIMLALALCLAACGDSEDTSSTTEPSGPGTTDPAETGTTTPPGDTTTVPDRQEAQRPLIYTQNTEIPVGDPHMLTKPSHQMLTWLRYDGLTQKLNGEIEPLLASSWEFGEGDEGEPYVEFTLEEGVTFPHDGTAFNADAVKQSVERGQTLEGSTVSGLLEGMTVEVVDDYTVRIYREAGVAPVPALMAGRAGSIISPVVIADNLNLEENEGGIGRFSVSERTAERLVLVQTDGYWNPDRQTLYGLEYQRLDPEGLTNAIDAGTVDIGYTNAGPNGVPQLETDEYEVMPFIQVEQASSFAINTSIPPMDNPDVRRALKLALDSETACGSLWQGRCFSVPAMFGLTDWSAPEIEPEFDIEEATQLIRDAGAEGASFTIISSDSQTWRDWVVYAEQQWRTIGLNPTIQVVPHAQAPAAFSSGEGAVGMISVGPYLDPSELIPVYLLPDSTYNPGGHVNERIAELAGQATATFDVEERRDLYHEISREVYNDNVIINLSQWAFHMYVKPTVTDFEVPLDLTYLQWTGPRLWEE